MDITLDPNLLSRNALAYLMADQLMNSRTKDGDDALFKLLLALETISPGIQNQVANEILKSAATD